MSIRTLFTTLAALTGLAMTVSTATAQSRASASYAAEARQLADNPLIRSAFASIEELDDWARELLIELTEIAAPPLHGGSARPPLCRTADGARGRFGLDRRRGQCDRVAQGSHGGGRTIAFGGHLDTVFPETIDVTVEERGDTLFAPGVGDDTRGLVVVLAVLRALEEAGIETEDDLQFIGTVGEEGLGDLRGMKHIYREGAKGPDAWIEVDGGGLAGLVVDGLGSVRYRVIFRGPGGHSWGAFGLANPAHAMGRAMRHFQDAADTLTRSGPRTSYNVGRVGGGTSVNAIPFQSWMEVDMRSVSPESLARIEAVFLAAMDRAVEEENALRRDGAPLTVEKDRIGDRPSGNGDRSAPLIERALATTAIFGVEGEFSRSSTNSNVPIALGIPAVTIGRGGIGVGAHSPGEYWVNVDGHLAIQRALLLVVAEAGMAELVP